MKRILLAVGMLALMSSPAFAAVELAVGGGYVMGVSGYSSFTGGTNGGLGGDAQLLFGSETFKFGILGGYETLYSLNLTVLGTTISSTVTAMPIFAMIKYNLGGNFYFDGGAGIASTTTAITGSANSSTTNAAGQAGLGYQIMMGKGISLNPAVDFKYFSSSSNSLSTVMGSLYLDFHF